MVVSLYSTNRRLQRNGVQMEVRTGAVSTDICATSTSLVSVGRRDNFPVRKSDENTKTPSWFVDTKVYFLLHFLSSRREKRNRE